MKRDWILLTALVVGCTSVILYYILNENPHFEIDEEQGVILEMVDIDKAIAVDITESKDIMELERMINRIYYRKPHIGPPDSGQFIQAIVTVNGVPLLIGFKEPPDGWCTIKLGIGNEEGGGNMIWYEYNQKDYERLEDLIAKYQE